MTPADFADLRQRFCTLHAELGAALLYLADAEQLLDPAGLAAMSTMSDAGRHAATACSALAHERMEDASRAAEVAAAHLADLYVELDRHSQSLAPAGVAP